MEVVNQIVVFFTPYLGEFARYVPVIIGTLLAVIAFVIRRRFVNKMNADIAAAKQRDTEANRETLDTSDDAPLQSRSQLDLAPAAETKEKDSVLESKPAALSWTQRIKSGLSRTRSGLGGGLSAVIGGQKKVDGDLLEELETQLLMADVGIDATQTLINGLTERLNRKELKDSTALLTHLKADMEAILEQSQRVLEPVSQDGPFVILMVGVNGVGKTTTIGKLAKKYQAEGKSVMLAAGDTFRAAAVEQLQVWGERNNVPVVAQHTGADSASVIYDAIESAKAKGIDIVIADTAGRLQNKANLMNELAKVVRVMKKLDENAPHEVMLVLDAGTGQNAISQAKLFSEAVGVSGITLTKLDGTAKGGIIFAIAKQFGLPIRYIGVGEQAEDLRPFIAKEFVDALFDQE
ncbi:signal recognition particle-docking protein FtsY [Marinomonas hwangdonensis]|uniref:Signal recognition particle receptor FtsY n=1 Tax=Marinomonas hwangdonensis TaxID=1053647 RepID=A0A3M8Q9Q9_9GAMM|nr:signal recognition particle-docking protein FtsY [Marinomonas hwangdonensis]RNF51790.1 signal recognition particle-docking protein FtsY [Marinomonas hwangdonensis]